MCWVLSVSTDEILILEVINHLIKIKMHVVSFDGVIKERLLHKEILGDSGLSVVTSSSQSYLI